MTTTFKQIEAEKQFLVRCEKSLALEKLKKRRDDTRRKIELGGLVIKSGISNYQKSIILGALVYILELIKKEDNILLVLESIGESLLS